MRYPRFLVILLFLAASSSAQENLSQRIDKQFLMGNFDYRNNPAFTKVSSEHSLRTVYLQKTVYEAFIQMSCDALREGVILKIISGTRNFEEQKLIWERKWRSLQNDKIAERPGKILKFSSMPATSRHHWGTDMDINSVEPAYFEKGKGKAEFEWLVTNAHKYGFHQVYRSKNSGRTGYEEEKWHWSYMPLASLYLRAYNEQIEYKDIKGFEGSNLAEENRLISDYVNGISPQPRIAVRLASLKAEPVVKGGILE